ncbi:MAG: hypothetical protein A4S14_08885 [Proteobacteria bacterium SG_bin9]|nr:MAG: hypothetical protein A4S14_08885 [Proteobacteria bacterium SG_bin9]
MSLAPLLNAPLQIQLHAFAAMAAFLLGIAQFVAPKGTLPHRTVGWIWVGLMLIVAISSFWIHGKGFRLAGPFGPIHLLSIMVLFMLPMALMFARRHNARGHAKTMIGIFIGGLVIAGLFTFIPGRLMHAVAFGG